MFGDFEDLETGEVHKAGEAKDSEGSSDEGDAASKDGEEEEEDKRKFDFFLLNHSI